MSFMPPTYSIIFPGIGEVLRNRLSASLLLRRKRVLYLKSRYGKTPIRTIQEVVRPVVIHRQPRPQDTAQAFHEVAVQLNESPPKAQSSPSVVQSTAKSATTLNAENLKKASNPSVISATNTVALTTHEGLIFPPAPRAQVKLVSIRDKGCKKAGLEVIYPYCFHALSGSEACDEKKWRSVYILTE